MALMVSALRRLFGEPTASRGFAYAREGRVRSLARSEDGSIVAEVEGSGGAVYAQRVRLHASADGALRSVEGACDCPIGFNCKHVVAALLALEATEQGRAPTLRPNLPPALEAWLARLAAAEAPEAAGDDYPETVRDRILYLLDVTETRAPTVTPMKATLKRDGSFGKNVRRYDLSRFGWTEPPKFVRPVDLSIVRELDRLGLGGTSSYAGYHAPRQAAPEPGEALALLARVAATGRGRWREAHGPVLGEGGSRRGRLVWRSEEDGRQRLGVVDAAERPLEALAVNPPAYVDPETGALGALELGTPSRLAAALLAAPEIPPEAAGEVAATLGRVGGGRLPAPRAIGSEVREGVAPTPVLRLFALDARRRVGRWGASTQTVSLPALRLAFDYAGRMVEAFPYSDPRFREGDTVVTLRRDRTAEDRAHARLEESGAERADHLPELAPGRGIGQLDRVFPVGLGENGLPALDADPEQDALSFVSETVPRLRAEGWRVEIDPSWPYRLHEGPVTIRAGLDGGDGAREAGRFSIALTLEAGDERLDLAPLILSIVAALPVGQDGALEEGFDLDEFLEDLTLHQRLSGSE